MMDEVRLYEILMFREVTKSEIVVQCVPLLMLPFPFDVVLITKTYTLMFNLILMFKIHLVTPLMLLNCYNNVASIIYLSNFLCNFDIIIIYLS